MSSTDNRNNGSSSNEDEINQKTSVAIVGSGAVGSYYGARLWECRDLYNVKFHIRNSNNFQACQQNGLYIKSIKGDIHIPSDQLQSFQKTNEMGGPYDWVIVALKTTALSEIPKLIDPLVDENTRVLSIMNGMYDDDLVDMMIQYNSNSTKKEELQCKAVFGGIAFTCCSRIDSSTIDHSATEAQVLGGIAATTNDADEKEELSELEKLWEPTKVPFQPETNLALARWKKNCWNVPFSSVQVSLQGELTIEDIVSRPSLRKLCDDIMDETIAIANADLEYRHNNPHTRSPHDNELPVLGDKEKEHMWFLSDNIGPYRTSTLLDFMARKPIEVYYLFGKPLERAKELGIPTPKLESVVAQIEGLQDYYNLY